MSDHPKPEEWAPYVFGEARPEARERLKAHLNNCPDCREEISSWQNSLGRLDAWRLSPRPKPRYAFAPILQWAAAAVVVLGLGFGIGRLSAARADEQKIGAAIAPGIRQQVRQEMAQWLREEAGRAGAASLPVSMQSPGTIEGRLTAVESANQELLALMEQMESQRRADLLTLRKALATVAVNADAGLRQTAQELVQLASYTQPANPSDPNHK